jgi:hypothetical protein
MISLPDRAIEGSNSHDIPIRSNPAPKGSIPVHPALARNGDPDVNKRRNERKTVAAEEIPFLQTTKLLGTILVVESEENVESHGKCPVRISRHKPRRHQYLKSEFCTQRRTSGSGSPEAGRQSH